MNDNIDRRLHAHVYATGKVDQIEAAITRKDPAEVGRIFRQIADDGYPHAVAAILKTLADRLPEDQLAIVVAAADENGED